MRATLRASASLSTGPSLPGTIGTPALRMVSRAATLSPMARMAELGGPMNLMLQFSQTSAKCAFSDKKP